MKSDITDDALRARHVELHELFESTDRPRSKNQISDQHDEIAQEMESRGLHHPTMDNLDRFDFHLPEIEAKEPMLTTSQQDSVRSVVKAVKQGKLPPVEIRHHDDGPILVFDEPVPKHLLESTFGSPPTNAVDLEEWR